MIVIMQKLVLRVIFCVALATAGFYVSTLITPAPKSLAQYGGYPGEYCCEGPPYGEEGNPYGGEGSGYSYQVQRPDYAYQDQTAYSYQLQNTHSTQTVDPC